MNTAQWANIDDDEGALHALIQRVAGHISVDIIDYLWIFPARKVAAGESVVVVVAAFDQHAERRRVLTARFTISRNRKGIAKVVERMDEHGAAPEDAVPRIVQGVLRRMGEVADAEPRAEQISGDPLRWDALVVELGGRPASTGEDGSAPGQDGSEEPAEGAHQSAPQPVVSASDDADPAASTGAASTSDSPPPRP